MVYYVAIRLSWHNYGAQYYCHGAYLHVHHLLTYILNGFGVGLGIED